MRTWKPSPSQRIWIAAGLLMLTLIGAAALLYSLIQQLGGPPESWRYGPVMFAEIVGLIGCLLLGGWLSYRIAGALTLHYGMDRNGLYVIWLGNRAVIPMEQIVTVDVGAANARLPWGPLQQVGYVWGRGRTADGTLLHLFSTRIPAQSLIVYTETEAYAIAPAEQQDFVQSLEQYRGLGAIKSVAPAITAGRMFLYSFWNDQVVRTLVVLALVINVLALGILAWRFPLLPELIELRFNQIGELAELRPRHQVLFMPLAAFGISLLNIVVGLICYTREISGTRLLQSSSVIAQILFMVAMLNVVL
jgi:hypothetical protein